MTDNIKITTDEIHKIVKQFHGYGAPSTYDDQGPNKYDWAFVDKMANATSLSWIDAAMCVSRLRKYRNTQI